MGTLWISYVITCIDLSTNFFTLSIKSMNQIALSCVQALVGSCLKEYHNTGWPYSCILVPIGFCKFIKSELDPSSCIPMANKTSHTYVNARIKDIIDSPWNWELFQGDAPKAGKNLWGTTYYPFPLTKLTTKIMTKKGNDLVVEAMSQNLEGPGSFPHLGSHRSVAYQHWACWITE